MKNKNFIDLIDSSYSKDHFYMFKSMVWSFARKLIFYFTKNGILYATVTVLGTGTKSDT